MNKELETMDRVIKIRLFEDDYKKVVKLAEQNPEIYDNKSHVVRCAVQQFLKECS